MTTVALYVIKGAALIVSFMKSREIIAYTTEKILSKQEINEIYNKASLIE